MPFKAEDPEEKFFRRIVIEANGCWTWTGYVKPNGYVQFAHVEAGKKQHPYLHRWSYEHFRGPIPEGLTIDHLCRVRHCANPNHLEPVTAVENVRRGNALSAQRGRQTHCLHGHEFTEDNTRRDSRGRRICVACYQNKLVALRHPRPLFVPKPCISCGVPRSPLRRGLCNRCNCRRRYRERKSKS